MKSITPFNSTDSTSSMEQLASEASTVLSEAIKNTGKSLNELCSASRNESICLIQKPKELANWCSGNDLDSIKSPLFRAALILQQTNSSAPLQWVCGQIGGVFVPGAQSFGKISPESRLPHDVVNHPELAEWLRRSSKILTLRKLLLRMMSDHRQPTGDEVCEFVLAWLSIKGWIEGYLQWTGHAAESLSGIQKPTSASSVVRSWRILKSVFGRKTSGECYSKRIATALGMSPSSVQKWQQIPQFGKAGTANPLDHVVALTRATESLSLVEWLCTKQGGTLCSASVEDLPTDSPWPQIYWEIIELEYTASRALIDRDVDSTEAKNLRKEWNDVRAWVGGFLKNLS